MSTTRSIVLLLVTFISLLAMVVIFSSNNNHVIEEDQSQYDIDIQFLDKDRNILLRWEQFCPVSESSQSVTSRIRYIKFIKSKPNMNIYIEKDKMSMNIHVDSDRIYDPPFVIDLDEQYNQQTIVHDQYSIRIVFTNLPKDTFASFLYPNRLSLGLTRNFIEL